MNALFIGNHRISFIKSSVYPDCLKTDHKVAFYVWWNVFDLADDASSPSRGLARLNPFFISIKAKIVLCLEHRLVFHVTTSNIQPRFESL